MSYVNVSEPTGSRSGARAYTLVPVARNIWIREDYARRFREIRKGLGQ